MNAQRRLSIRTASTRGELRSGFTIIEAAFSSLIAAIMLTTALSASSAAGLVQYRNSERARGRSLAQALLSEIVVQAYIDPTNSKALVLGPDGAEKTGNRSAFNDVDDYDGWVESPPTTAFTNKDGSAILDSDGVTPINFTGWTRSVSVCWVQPSDFTKIYTNASPPSSDTKLKRITVSVSHNGVTVATLVALRGNGL